MTIVEPTRITEVLRERISSGQGWYETILWAASLWPLAEEEVDGERYVYLLDGEALDLLRLFERLYLEVGDLVPEHEFAALIANDTPPGEYGRSQLKTAVGHEKYRAYLTFIYGVLVEEMVVHSVVEEFRKRRRASGLTHYDADLDDAYQYVYGGSLDELVQTFRIEKRRTKRRRMTLTEMKEFTYWLFKSRLRISDKSRVASDTKRAITILHRYIEAKKNSSR